MNKSIRAPHFKFSHLYSLALAILVLFLNVRLCQAVVYQWDADPGSGGIQDGVGSWNANNPGNLVWTTDGGATSASWPAASVTGQAVFGGGVSGTAGTISMVDSLANAPMVDAITFNTPFAGDYTLAGSGGNLQLVDGTTISVNGGNPAINISMGPGSASPNAGFKKLGSGTLSLGAANTFSNLTISAGAVAVGNDNNMGFVASALPLRTNELTLDGGTLMVTNTFTWGSYRGIYLTAKGGTINVAPGKTLAMSGGGSAPESISGVGNLTITGGGLFTMQDNTPNTQSGFTQVSGNGTRLNLVGNNAIPLISAGGLLISNGAVVTVSSGKSGMIANGASVTNLGGMYVAGGNETNNYLVLGGDGVFTNGTASTRQLWVTSMIILQSGSIKYSENAGVNKPMALIGLATLLKNTSGTAYIVGTNFAQIANSFVGKTTISGGILNIGFDTALGANPTSFTPDQLTMDGGTLQITNGYVWGANRGITLTGNGGTLDIASGQTQTIPVVIAGTSGGNLAKTGAGTLRVTAANTYNGITTVSVGKLLINGANASGVNVANGATLGGTGTVSGSVSYASGAQGYFYKTAGSSDTPLTVSSALTLNNNIITVDLGGSNLDVGTYRLINYSGTKTGSFNATPTIVNGSTTQAATIDQTTANQVNLVVGSSAPLSFSTVVQSGSNLIFSGSGGQANSSYYILSSTNIALTLSTWTPVATNQFDGGGNFTFTKAMDSSKQKFFVIKLP